MSEASETTEFKETPLPLETIGDVRRALARFIRQIHAGSLKPGVGMALVNGCGALAKVMEQETETAVLERLTKKKAEAARGVQSSLDSASH